MMAETEDPRQLPGDTEKGTIVKTSSTTEHATAAMQDKVRIVVADYQNALLCFALQFLWPDEAIGRDVVQMTFIKYHRTLLKNGVESIDNTKAWLFKVARNLSLDVLRKNKRKQAAEERMMNDPVLSPDLGSYHSGVSDLEKRELYTLALKELHTLPEEYREVLLMKHVRNMTLREISEVTGIKIGTVNYRIKQGLVMLVTQLRDKRVEVQS
jgi:RNA polymerase sigma-70 factor (ECF subfamily)